MFLLRPNAMGLSCGPALWARWPLVYQHKGRGGRAPARPAGPTPSSPGQTPRLQLSKQMIVFGVRSDPEPDVRVVLAHREGTITQADPDGEDGARGMNLLEPEA